jgi:hypothetical protein
VPFRGGGNAVAGAHLSLMASRSALACLPASARSARIFCARTSAVCPKGRCSTIAPARRDTAACRRDLVAVSETVFFFFPFLFFFRLSDCVYFYGD